MVWIHASLPSDALSVKLGKDWAVATPPNEVSVVTVLYAISDHSFSISHAYLQIYYGRAT